MEREEKQWARCMAEFSTKSESFWFKICHKKDTYFTPEQLTDLGVIDEDNAEGALFYPILSAAVKEWLPGTADSIRAIKDNELMQGTLAAGKALLGYAGEAAGLTDSETYDFDKSYDDEK